jgi:hypothetical protein
MSVWRAMRKWLHASFETELELIGLKSTFHFPIVIIIYGTPVLPAFIIFDPKQGTLFSDRLFFTLSPENIREAICSSSQSQWLRGPKHETFLTARAVESLVRIPLEAWMSVCVYSHFVLFCV